MIGIVTTELRSESGGEHQGRITYENRGECFFLPYGKEDVEGYVTLKPGDKVSFQIATNQRLEIVSCTFHFIFIIALFSTVYSYFQFFFFFLGLMKNRFRI